jgi:hypothetical protein
MANPHGVFHTMKNDDSEVLRQFFGAYFHQDWSLDAPDADGIVQLFISHHRCKEELSRLALLIDAYASSEGDEAKLERALRTDLWCEYQPSVEGIGAREWLAHVSSLLRNAAASRS